jgi:hypothetical protein
MKIKYVSIPLYLKKQKYILFAFVYLKEKKCILFSSSSHLPNPPWCHLLRSSTKSFIIANELEVSKVCSKRFSVRFVFQDFIRDHSVIKLVLQNLVVCLFMGHRTSGTGKTLIVKTLADILSVKSKIASGLELFNWLLGESEAKVRALLDDAHSDQANYGSQSPLHFIIFDEIEKINKWHIFTRFSLRQHHY